MLTDKLSWERDSKCTSCISCPLGALVWWQLQQGTRSGCTALVSSDRKKQLNFNHFSYREQIFDGEQPSYLKASQKLTNELQQ